MDDDASHESNESRYNKRNEIAMHNDPTTINTDEKGCDDTDIDIG